MDPKPLTILQLQASNVKRLRAVNIRPDGQVVVLGGKNGAGKSSVLDAITYALAGERAICREPLRRGAEKGEVEVDLGEFRVRRTFTKEGGGTLSVLSPEGARYPSPQALLDKVTGRLSFDPLAFASMEPAKQSEALRRLVGLDFTEQDAERARVFEERTAVNRDGKALRARFDAMPVVADAPAEEVSAVAILQEQDEATRAVLVATQEARAFNEQNAEKRRAAKGLADKADQTAASLDALKASHADAVREVERWKKIADQRGDAVAATATLLADLRAMAKTGAEKVAGLKDADLPAPVDLAPFTARLNEVEAINRRVRAAKARAECEAALEAKRQESLALSARLESIDQAKAAAIAAAPMPVDGLGFDAEGVTFRGLPLDQASHAERLRVSVAIGLAMNPRLKVLLIRDASLLDEDGLRLVAEMAHDAGAQVWLERVGKDDATTVLIEDGAVVETTAPVQA